MFIKKVKYEMDKMKDVTTNRRWICVQKQKWN